jgi:hypothetical protein
MNIQVEVGRRKNSFRFAYEAIGCWLGVEAVKVGEEGILG